MLSCANACCDTDRSKGSVASDINQDLDSMDGSGSIKIIVFILEFVENRVRFTENHCDYC